MKSKLTKLTLAAVLVIAAVVQAQTIDWTAENITISNAAQLAEFRDQVNGIGVKSRNFTNQTITLINDIDLNGNEENQWIPIGNSVNSFRGSFDGNGKIIKGVYSNDGLFGEIMLGTIKNLGVVVDIIAKYGKVGGLVSFNNMGIIENCYAIGNVTGDSWIGGLVGYNLRGSIENSYATVNVTGNGGNIGGLVGSNNDGSIENSYATGNVTGNGGNIGGLVGTNDGSIENSYATGDVTTNKYGSNNIGGLVGENEENGTIKNCYATGNVTRNTNENSTSGSGCGGVGGLVGCNRGYVAGSYAAGNAASLNFSGSVISYYVGGFIGVNEKNGTIENCYAIGNATGSGDVGGLAGINKKNGSIENCYAIGNVTGYSAISRFAGENIGVITNSYASGSVNRLSELYTGGEFVGKNNEGTISNSDMKTMAKMRQQSTFINWDFVDIWAINTNTNCGHPYLQAIDGVLLSGNCKTDQTTPIPLQQFAKKRNILAYATGNTIVLQKPPNAKVDVYNIQGKLIFTSGKSLNRENRGSDNLVIPVQTKGMYVIKIGTQTIRVVVR